jgi:hypothetical protein
MNRLRNLMVLVVLATILTGGCPFFDPPTPTMRVRPTTILEQLGHQTWPSWNVVYVYGL